MSNEELFECMERSPIIAAVRQEQWTAAIQSPVEVIFHLRAGIMTVGANCGIYKGEFYAT